MPAFFICPTCNGSGKLFGIFPHYPDDVPKKKRKLFITPDCYRCNGTGKVDKQYKKWIKDGKILKEKRIKKQFTLRNAAKFLRMNPVILSNMECGVIKPNLNIHYDTIKVIRK